MSLFGKITSLLGHDEEQSHPSRITQEQEKLLKHVIDMTDFRIANMANYGDTLLPAVNVAQAYFEQTLDCVPGPIALDSNHPTLARLFPQPEDMVASLGRSLSVKNELEALEKAGHARLYALLGVRSKPGEDGQTVIADHTVRSLGVSPAAVRHLLKIAAFDSLLQGFANENLHYDKKLEQARMQKELLQEARLSAARPLAAALATTPARAHHEQSPEQVLAGLQDWLYAPQSRLRLETGNCYTIAAESADEEDWNFPLLVTQDRRQWYVCLIGFPINMAKKALAAEHHNHRFIMI
ncbi:hypothetical protein AGMMS49545_08460 [Betaproteobacteria bacterium]|nr:hypothetical protein AGMMS49545_08460 [Betaproteobacteria bacterium]GHU41421.1 hypothetical protein AGMMS50289_04540 [Betaproteobacteria bacterium]